MCKSGMEQEDSRTVNNKSRKIIIILAAAIFAAIAAGVAAYMYLVPQTTVIYMFNSSYSTGDTVTESMLTTVVVDSEIMAGGTTETTGGRFVTINTLDSVLSENNVLRMDVAAGMPLTYSMLSVTGGSAVESYMDPSKIAVTVSVNSVTGITDDLKDGSRVNIYVAGISGAGITLFMQNMRILEVHRNDGSLASVTVECDQNEALKLIYAATYSSIYLGLVDASSYAYVDGEPAYVPATDASPSAVTVSEEAYGEIDE